MNKKKKSCWGPALSEINTNIKRQDAKILAKELSGAFSIGIQSARNTLKATTQKGIRMSLNVTKRFKTQPFRNKRQLPGRWYSDMIFFKEDYGTSIV